MKIRKATKKDTPRILKLFNSDPNLVGNDDIKYTRNHILEYITNPVNKMFIYEMEGKIAGAILAEFWKKAKYVYINVIVVDPAYRRKGIGTQLIQYIEKLAKDQKIYLLFGLTEENNIKIQKLMKKVSYKKGKRFYFYSKRLK